MFFSFFRKIRRTVCTCIVIAALAVLLKYECPEIGNRVGRWISGLENTRIAQAVSSMLSSLSDGDSFLDSIEVFHDNLQTQAAD